MTSKLWRVAVFVLALLAFVIARAPAGLVAPRSDRFSYERASGSVWDGRLERVRMGALGASTMSWRISPLDILQGKLIAPVRIGGGDITGEGRYLANWEGDRRVVVSAATISGLPIGQVILPGETQVEGFDVFFDAGACARAQGQVRSDVLVRAGQVLGFVGPPMSGVVVCDGDDAVIALSGETPGAESVSAALRLRGDGSGEWRVSVRTAKTEVQAALIAAGLTATANADELVRTERISWLPE